MHKEYDVAVIGLGTAGAISLIAAARLGLSVIGIERLNGMGGTGTLGGIKGYYFGSQGGLYEEINKKALEISHSLTNAPNIDAKVYALECAAIEAGAEVLYETVVCDVIKDGKCAKGIVILLKGKTYEIRTKYIIDCTGDTHVLKMFGCNTRRGRTFDGGTQPYTNSMISLRDGQVHSSNTDAGYLNQYDLKEYSRAVLESMAAVDTKESCDIITNASILGIREGATIEGEQNITFTDVFSKKTYEKPLFYAYSNIDYHGKDTVFEEDAIKEWYVVGGLWGINFSIPVPLGALIPKGFHGLLAAGRHIAVDHNTSSLVRMKSDMEKCGEAAAIIAYLSIKEGVPAKDVDYEKLMEYLHKTGCAKGDYPLFINRDGLERFEWPDTPEKVRKELEEGRPGIGIWGAKIIGDKMVKYLEEWVLEETFISNYSAVALGLLGKKTALPKLRIIAGRQDMTIPKTSLKYIYTLGTTAIYLLGRLGDAESVDMLCNIVRSRGDFNENEFVPDEFYATPVDMRFQLFSYAVAALLDIREKCPDIEGKIVDFLNDDVLQSDENMPITLKGAPNVKINMFPKIKEYVLWRLKIC